MNEFWGGLGRIIAPVMVLLVAIAAGLFLWSKKKMLKVDEKNIERGLKLVPFRMHLPPATDDVDAEGRDARQVAEQEISEAEKMYQILASTLSRDSKYRMYGQKPISFEIIATGEGVQYYVLVPVTLVDIVRQAVAAAYPTARLERVNEPNIFSEQGGKQGTLGGELVLRREYPYPIATYLETKSDSALSIINALSLVKEGDGATIQIVMRPAAEGWEKLAMDEADRIRDGKKSRKKSGVAGAIGYLPQALAALWKPPEAGEKEKESGGKKPLTNLQQAEVEAIESKLQHPGFETSIRVIVSSATKVRAESILNSLVAVFSQFNSTQLNGFQYNMFKDIDGLITDYIFRIFPRSAVGRDILNSVELATLFHLPSQNAIPTSKVQKQQFKQVDGPSVLADEGVLLGANEFRGEKKEIRLGTVDRRRHLYMIGGTGVGKTGFLHNLAYQDMMDGRGFAFIDPHGDAVEELMAMVPEERIDDIIYFDPGELSNPVGMNMFEFDHPDQKDMIVQEATNMLQSLYDPQRQGIFGPRAEHMFRNAALLLMSDPAGGTFIDVPKCFIDVEFVKHKLQYVTDKTVYDYWTKEFPASQKSSEAGEVVTWFVSKWGPFLSNTMMRNIIGQTTSGLNIRKVMDEGKILLVNLSKGKMGEMNSKLLGMIFVMKFQAAAMSRADTPEDERRDFCLFVDEFQNFSTESFESIMSEARKYRLSLVLANQFMTQLTDTIREAIIGNVGTVISGRIGITDGELLQKKFTPTFTAEDLARLPNYQAIASVMINSVPSAPFSMSLLPPMGEANEQLQNTLKAYSAATYGRPRAEVEAEISARLAVGPAVSQPVVVSTASSPAAPKNPILPGNTPTVSPAVEAATKEYQKSFMDGWMEKKKEIVAPALISPQAAPVMAAEEAPRTPTQPLPPEAATVATERLKTETTSQILQKSVSVPKPAPAVKPVPPKPPEDPTKQKIRKQGGDSERRFKIR